MPAVSLVSHLDRLFGDGFISFLRDPENDTMTVSVTHATLLAAGFSADGWRYVMGARYCVRTMRESDWSTYLAETVDK